MCAEWGEMTNQVQCPNCGFYKVIVDQAYLEKDKIKVQTSANQEIMQLAVGSVFAVALITGSWFAGWFFNVSLLYGLSLFFVTLLVIAISQSLNNIRKARRGDYYTTKIDWKSGGT